MFPAAAGQGEELGACWWCAGVWAPRACVGNQRSSFLGKCDIPVTESGVGQMGDSEPGP